MAKKLTSREQPKTLPGGGTPPIILNQIDVRPFGRREQDIPSWRNALKAAESAIPRRVLLYDLYADVDLDGHVEAVTGKRRDAVTTANWQFLDKAGKPVDEINQIIDSIGFEEMLKEIINSKFWGYSMFEPTFYKAFDGTWEMESNLLPRLNYRPEKGILAKDFISDEGINVREGIYAKTIMEVGNPSDLGLYLKASPYQVLKRGGLGDYALFVQVFGNPLVDATWDGFDEQQRIKLLQAIDALGSGGAIVRPKGTDITLIENKSNATGDLQVNFLNFNNKEISKALLGSTETTEASTASGYAQAKTHSEQDERKNESDITFTRRILNSRFAKILSAHGFNVMGGKFVVEGESNELTVKESFEMQMTLKEKGIHIDDDFFYETYSIPKPKTKPKEPRTDRARPVSEKDQKTQNPTEKDVELSLADKFLNLFSFFVPAPAQTGAPKAVQAGHALPQTPTCCGDHRTINLAVSADPSFKSLLKAVKEADGKGFIYPEMVAHNIEVLTKAFLDGWQSKELVALMDLGIDYHTLDPKMSTVWEMNIFRFSTTKAAYQSAEVNSLFRRSKNFAEFERAVRKTYGVKYKPWLITEYNTAYQTAEAAATYYRILAQAKTFPYVQYKTIGDDRVRDAHRLLHDAVFPIYIELDGKQVINPVLKKISPPNGWGCRCYWVPRLAGEVTPQQLTESMRILEQFEQSEEWAKAKKSGFGINRADAEEVFTRDQFYTSDPEKVLKKAAKLPFETYTLKPAKEEQAIRAQRNIQPDKEPQSQPALKILDYAARPITINPNQGKPDYFRYLPETLNSPDEVWVNGDNLGSFVYVKYFKNVILEIIAKLEKTGNLEVDTWNEGTTNRRGILIKK